MLLDRINPTRDLFRVQDEMSRLIDQFLSTDLMGGRAIDTSFDWLPVMDVQEDKDKFTIHMDLPGLTKDDVSIYIRDNVLTIEGEKKREFEDKDVNYHRIERRYGKFKRSFSIPTRVEEGKIDARFKDGVLTIVLPKVEEVKPKAIEVKVEK
jgi:HSP20 family protein